MVTTIQNGKKALTDSIANLQVPADLTGDLSSQKWKDSQLNSSKQNVVSQVAAMNAATAQMVIYIFLQEIKYYLLKNVVNGNFVIKQE